MCYILGMNTNKLELRRLDYLGQDVCIQRDSLDALQDAVKDILIRNDYTVSFADIGKNAFGKDVMRWGLKTKYGKTKLFYIILN